MNEIEWIGIRSGAISRIAIDGGDLLVNLVWKDMTVRYYGAAAEFSGLTASDSAGGYFNKFIRNNYKFSNE